MSDTFASRNLGSVYAGVSTPKGKTSPYQTYDAGIYPGYACRLDSSARWNLSKNSDKSNGGIVGCAANHGLDTVYTATTDYAEGYKCGLGDEVWAWYVLQSPSVDLYQGDRMVASATDGMLMKFAYTDGTDITDSPLNQYGRFDEPYKAGSTSSNQLIKLILT